MGDHGTFRRFELARVKPNGCFFEGLTRSELLQVVFCCFQNESFTFLIIPERPMSIQKLSGSKVRKAGAVQHRRVNDVTSPVSANQTDCLHVCFTPDYGTYV